jgi:hypothetical protein
VYVSEPTPTGACAFCQNALYLVFRLVHRLSLKWRAINAPNQLSLLLRGLTFVDGRIRLDAPSSSASGEYAA